MPLPQALRVRVEVSMVIPREAGTTGSAGLRPAEPAWPDRGAPGGRGGRGTTVRMSMTRACISARTGLRPECVPNGSGR
jgi:hypothetical protein